MPVSCLAANCKKEKNLHPFPLDSSRRKSWIAFVKEERDDFDIERHYRPSLCNDHFDEKSIANFMEVQAGLARVYMLKSDAIPTKHIKRIKKDDKSLRLHHDDKSNQLPSCSKPAVAKTQRSASATGSRKSENNSKTLQFSKCMYCQRNVYGSLKSHIRGHGFGRELYQSNLDKSQMTSPQRVGKFRLKQQKLIAQNITESFQMQNIPVDLSIRLSVSGDKSSIIYVTDMNSSSSFSKVVTLLCNIFKVLVLEQNLGVIAGRICDPMDRLVRVTDINKEHIHFICTSPTFRISKGSQAWPEFFTDDQLEKAIILRMKHLFTKEADQCKLIEPLWKPTLRLQKYTGLMQESARVVTSTVPILG